MSYKNMLQNYLHLFISVLDSCRYKKKSSEYACKLDDLLYKDSYINLEHLCNEKFKVYKETKSLKTNYEDVIPNIITQLKKIESEKHISGSLCLQSFEFMMIALDCLLIIAKDKEKVTELRKQLEVEYCKLNSEVYGTKEPIKIPHLQNDSNSNESSNSPEKLVKKDWLSLIERETDRATKISAYINRVFVQEFGEYWFNKLSFYLSKAYQSDESQIIIEKITENALNDISGGKNDLASKYYATFTKNNVSSFSILKVLNFLIQNGDAQFWRTFFRKSLAEIQEKKKYNAELGKAFSKDEKELKYVEATFARLNFFRNVSVHSGASVPSFTTLINTIQTLVNFFRKIKSPIMATKLERHLFYERYANWGFKTGKQIKSYSDVDYRFYSEITTGKNLSPWKDVVEYNISEEEPCDTKKTKLERAEFVAKYFFSKHKDNYKENINRLKEYYSRNAVMFSPYINGEGFSKMLELGYPFHPAFFVITQSLSMTTLIKLAKRAINKELASGENNVLVMPWSIVPSYSDEIIPEFDIKFAEKFNSEDFNDEVKDNAEMDFLLDGWFFHRRIEINSDSFILRVAKDNSKLAEKVASVIVLLMMFILYFYEEKKGYSAVQAKRVYWSREWIRFCSTDPRMKVSDFEEILDFLTENSIMVEKEEGLYWYSTVSDYTDRMYLELVRLRYSLDEEIDAWIASKIRKKYPEKNIVVYDGNLKNPIIKELPNYVLITTSANGRLLAYRDRRHQLKDLSLEKDKVFKLSEKGEKWLLKVKNHIALTDSFYSGIIKHGYSEFSFSNCLYDILNLRFDGFTIDDMLEEIENLYSIYW